MNGLDGTQPVDLVAVSPVLITAAGMVAVLLLDAVAPRRGGVRHLHDLLTLASLAGALIAVGWLSRGDGLVRETFCAPAAGLQLRSCSYVVSSLTLVLQGLLIGSAIVCVLLAVNGPGAADRAPHHALLLAAVTGAAALAGSRDLISLIVALETASLPVVALVALRRDAQGAQAAVTLLLTAVGSLGVLLLGAALLFFATGSLHLDRIALALAPPAVPGQVDLPASVRAVALLGVLFAVAGIGFKLSLVPFHFWTPDTYAGAPLPVAAFLSVVSKTAGAAAIVVLLAVGLPTLGASWAPIVAVIAAVTMTVGNVVALRQRVAVRLLAWSTVAQAGWVILPLAAVGSAAPAAARSAVGAAIGYLAAYSVATLAAFAVVILLARHHPSGEDHQLEAYRGLARREPVASAVLAFALVSLAGLPPGVVGLVAKVTVLRPLVGAGLWPLAAVAVVNVVLAIVYYLRWAALLVTATGSATAAPSWRVRPAEGWALGISGAACVALSIWPQALFVLVDAGVTLW